MMQQDADEPFARETIGRPGLAVYEAEQPEGDPATASVTCAVLLEKDPKWGFPRRLGIYEISEPQKAGREYRAHVVPMKELGVQILLAMFGPTAATKRDARDLAIGTLQRIAGQSNLELLIRTHKRCR